MKFMLLAALAIVGCGSATPVVPRPTQSVVPIAEYFKIKKTQGASFNFDETLLAYGSDEGGRMDVWVTGIDGSNAHPVTQLQGALATFAFSPTADMLLIAADVGGDENTRLYFTDSTGKALTPLFPEDPKTVRVDFVRWAEDGKTLLYTANRRDEKSMDLYEYDVATAASKILWQGDGKLGFAFPSRDHRRFVFTEEVSDTDTNMYLLDRDSSQPQLITKHSGDVAYEPLDFSVDGKTLYCSSDATGEFRALYALDLATMQSRVVLAPKWDVFSARVSRTGKYLAASIANDGAADLVITDVASGKPISLPPSTASFLAPVFSKSDRYLALRAESDDAPRSLVLVDLVANTAKRVIDPVPTSLAGRPFTRGRSIRVKSFDGLQVPAFVYSPPGRGPFPALLDIHGGPTAQASRVFRPFVQYLVSKGYVVMVPNVRGSTGFGKTFSKGDNKDFGGAPLEDVRACKAWLVANANVDPDRVAIMGQSYGGYMTLAAATFRPTAFAVHIDLFGIVDLKTLVESFPLYWASSAAYIYQKFGNPNDPADAKYQHDRSPLYAADKIQRPLLVIQGANDPRVKKEQSDRIVAAVKAHGTPVEYLVIDGEGHGFSKTENQVRALEAADKFLDRYMLAHPNR